MKKLCTFLVAALALAGCSQTKKNDQTDTETKSLVLYYSQTGTTQQLAQTIAGLLDTEAIRFDVEQPYSGTFEETIARCQSEMESDSVPALAPLDIDLSGYDTIFLGFPVWFGTYARPVMSLLSQMNFEGKTIVPFCTFGSGGLESSVSDLRAACPGATVTDGYGVRTIRIAKAEAEVKQFLVNKGYLEGEAEEEAAYGEQQPVGQAEKDIFNAACGDYPMPIGTPVSAASRTTGDTTDYLFTVTSAGRDGEAVEARVYITCVPGEQPEFIRVVR